MVLLKSVVSSQWSAVRKGFSIVAITLIAHCSLLIADAKAEEKVYKVDVEGMHCNMCVYRVTKSIKKLRQVKEVDVTVGAAVVTLNDGEDLTQDALKEAIEDSGYKFARMESVIDRGGLQDEKIAKKGDQ